LAIKPVPTFIFVAALEDKTSSDFNEKDVSLPRLK